MTVRVEDDAWDVGAASSLFARVGSLRTGTWPRRNVGTVKVAQRTYVPDTKDSNSSKPLCPDGSAVRYHGLQLEPFQVDANSSHPDCARPPNLVRSSRGALHGMPRYAKMCLAFTNWLANVQLAVQLARNMRCQMACEKLSRIITQMRSQVKDQGRR